MNSEIIYLTYLKSVYKTMLMIDENFDPNEAAGAIEDAMKAMKKHGHIARLVIRKGDRQKDYHIISGDPSDSHQEGLMVRQGFDGKRQQVVLTFSFEYGESIRQSLGHIFQIPVSFGDERFLPAPKSKLCVFQVRIKTQAELQAALDYIEDIYPKVSQALFSERNEGRRPEAENNLNTLRF